MRKMTGRLLGLAALVAASFSQAQAGERVVFGIGVDPTFAHVVIAKEKGFFESNGIDAVVKTFGFGSLTLDAVLAGETDVAMATELPTISAGVKGDATVVVAANYTAPNYNAVVTRNDIDAASGLVGKTLAVKKNTASEYFLSRFLRKYNVAADQVTIKNVAPSEMVPAFDRGDIDAFFVWEPWPSKALEIAEDAKIFARGGDDGGIYTMINLVSFSKKLAADRDTAARILKALVEADEYIAAHPEETVKMSAKAFNLTEELAKTALDRVAFRIQLTDEILAWQRDAAVWLRDAGAIEGAPDWDDFVDGDLLRSVAPDRVEF